MGAGEWWAPCPTVTSYEHERFNEQSVGRFISDFRATISFAKLTSGAILKTDDEEQKAQKDLKTGTVLPPMGEGMSKPQVIEQPQTPSSAPKVAPQFRDFTIPRRGQRLAILRLEYPVTEGDIQLIADWLKLMTKSLEDEKGGDDK